MMAVDLKSMMPMLATPAAGYISNAPSVVVACCSRGQASHVRCETAMSVPSTAVLKFLMQKQLAAFGVSVTFHLRNGNSKVT